ncbi:hypothetical protein Ahy_A10g051350 [Arachis hypogaea]|uniref:Uncharacterized protein n=1 Tax=Arachis hypogaea TaxID=3818 RepID=A0A445BCH3_ARAHY|nr:hypothetical protein Ahy_A10g051350 [Arachis hypogaea]
MRSRIKFTDKNPLSVFMRPSTSFIKFKDIIQKLGLQGVKRVEKLFYRILISILWDDVKYDSFVIGSDKDLEVLFHYRRQFPEVRTLELLAKLVDVVSNSGGSNWNLLPSATAVGLSSRPIGASSSLSVIETETVLVASPSFAADLNRTRDRERVDTVLAFDLSVEPVPDLYATPSAGSDHLWGLRGRAQATRIFAHADTTNLSTHERVLDQEQHLIVRRGLPCDPNECANPVTCWEYTDHRLSHFSTSENRCSIRAAADAKVLQAGVEANPPDATL